ncbi:MAG: site-2 protease family protein [Acidimicrobiia bacterium]|nr:site-2 protease family protein [Acidimicrobiia bacterium]MDX2468083.1 site-2 protease family protein [Acidimicrobiia bacterium]
MNARQIGTFRGIPIKLHWGAVAVAAVLGLIVANSVFPQLAPGMSSTAYLIGGAIAGAALLGSLLVHVASQALVAPRYGGEVSSFTLWFLGGVAHLEDEAPSPRAEAQIAGAGPASSLAIAVVFLGLGWIVAISEISPLLSATLFWIGGLNAVLGIFNLLPGAPLDGGRLLHAWLWKRHGDRSRATAGASKAGRVVGILVAAIGAAEFLAGNPGGLWTAFIGWFLYTAAGQEAKTGRLSAVLRGRSLAEIMSPLPPSIANWSLLRDVVTADTGDDRIMAVDFGGSVTALTSRSAVFKAAAVAAQRNSAPERLRDLPFPEPTRLEEDQPASTILRHPGRPILVTRNSSPVGIVTAVEIDRIVAMHHLAPKGEDVAA